MFHIYFLDRSGVTKTGLNIWNVFQNKPSLQTFVDNVNAQRDPVYLIFCNGWVFISGGDQRHNAGVTGGGSTL